MRPFLLILTVVGAYALLRGWAGGPGLLLRSCLAVATLIAAIMAPLPDYRASRKKKPLKNRVQNMRRANYLDRLSLGVLLVFITTFFVVFISTLIEPAQSFASYIRATTIDLANNEPLQQQDSTDTTNAQLNYGGDQSGPWNFSKNLNRELPQQSNHKPSSKPEVFIQLKSSRDTDQLLTSRIHVSAFSFTRFNGLSWSAKPITHSTQRSPIRFQKTTPIHTPIHHQIYHASNPTGQNIFTSLQGALTTNVSQLTKIAASIYLLPEADDVNVGYHYTATSSPVHFSDLAATIITPAPASEDELKVPARWVNRFEETAQLFRQAPDTYKQLQAIRNHLRKNYTYSLKTSNPNATNPLENFLYSEKRGHCEHFATAAAMYCRTLGIPSRIAYGWSGGQLYEDQNMFVFRAKDAHAWTEIKLQGYGWVIFDVTPPNHDAIPETQKAPKGEKAPDPSEALHLKNGINDNGVNMTLGAGLNSSQLIIGFSALSIFVLGFFVIRSMKKSETSPDGRPLNHHHPGYLLAFKKASTALGYPMPLGSTLLQHITTLRKKSIHPDFSNQLLEYHYQMMYGESQKETAIEKQLIQSIIQWRNSYVDRGRS